MLTNRNGLTTHTMLHLLSEKKNKQRKIFHNQNALFSFGKKLFLITFAQNFKQTHTLDARLFVFSTSSSHLHSIEPSISVVIHFISLSLHNIHILIHVC